MAVERETVPVSLPKKLVETLDRLVEEGRFSSRSEALRYGARIVTERGSVQRLHELTSERAKEQVKERLRGKMYLDTDIILALIKDEDWLQSEFEERKLEDPKTSVVTVTEVQLVYIDEKPREFLEDVLHKIDEHGIEILEIDRETVEKSSGMLSKHEKLNVFDSLHLAHSARLEEPIISTDTLYPEIDEVENRDPRNL